MRILPGVTMVGSGWLGHSLSHPLDCSVYLVGGPERAVLIDAGCGLASDVILANIEQAGVSPAAISHVLLTHAHPDHAAGAASIAAATGAELLASAAVAEILRNGDENTAGLTAARRAGIYPAGLALPPVDVTAISDGCSWDLPCGVLSAIATPGHAAGHLCFLLTSAQQRSVFTGDLVFARGRAAVLATPDADLRALHGSIDRIAALAPDALLPGHGELVLSGTSRHLEVALTAFQNEQLPPSLGT